MNLFSQILSDDGGNPSSARAAMLLSLSLVLTAWLVVSIHRDALQNIPDNVLWLLSVLIGAKTVQKFGETKPPGASISSTESAAVPAAASTPATTPSINP